MPKTILIIEDEKPIQNIIRAFLEDAGYRAVSADDGAEGIARFRECRPDLVLLDILLPKINGFAVCEMIRRESSTSVIMLTALDDDFSQMKGFDALADDYITKPFSMPLVVRRIEAVLRRMEKGGAGEEDTQLRYRDIVMDPDNYDVSVGGENVSLTYERDGKETSVTLTPEYDEELGYARVGLGSAGYTRADLLSAFSYGTYEVKYWIQVTIDSLRMLVTGQIGVDQLSGPVGIVDVVDDAYQQSRSYGVLVVTAQMLNLAILLSANLGVMNLLPLPALDGGRLVFLFVEAVRKKRVPPEKEGYVHFAGIVLLMLLMVVVMYNDIQRVFF